MKTTFTSEEQELLKSACDIILKNSGIQQLKEISEISVKFEDAQAEYTEKERKFLQQFCDVILRNSGLTFLRVVVAILNKVAERANLPI